MSRRRTPSSQHSPNNHVFSGTTTPPVFHRKLSSSSVSRWPRKRVKLNPGKCLLLLTILALVFVVEISFYTTASHNAAAQLLQANDPKGTQQQPQPKTTEKNQGEKGDQPRTPVIIIPGAMGSLLEAKLDKKESSLFCYSKSDWYTLWITESALAASKCFFQNIRMKYIGNGKVEPAEGVDMRVPYYGDSVEGVRCILHHTEKTCKATRNWLEVIVGMKKRGYQVGTDLFSAPYDFRRGPADYMEDAYPRLKALVEHVYEANGQRPVAFVSISLGGPFMHTFFTRFAHQAWKDKYVDGWLTLSGLFNGFAQSFQNTVFGRSKFLGLPAIFEQTDVRDTYRSWASAVMLIPKPIYGDNRVILETPSRNYTLSDMGELLFDDQAAMYADSFEYNVSADPGVPTDCWYTRAIPTHVGFRIKQDFTREVYYSKGGIEVEPIIGKGDDAADRNSLEICKRWPSVTSRHQKRCHACYLTNPKNARQIIEWLGNSADRRKKMVALQESSLGKQTASS